ncbi:MAG: hypothetical protein RIR79_377 [Pseudomonadota bacterium]
MRSVLRLTWWGLLLTTVWLSACNTVSLGRAPVEDRGGFDNTMGGVAPSPSTKTSGKTFEPVIVTDLPPAGTTTVASAKTYGSTSDYAGGQSGAYHTVKPKETMYSLGRLYGVSPKDIARWNDMETNPLPLLKIGQVVRITPPGSNNTPPSPAPSPSSSKPLGVPVAAAVVTAPAATATPAATTTPSAAPEMASTGAVSTVANVTWSWPNKGRILAGFDEERNKGIDIGGALGDPVLAAADGTVVYAAAGLRGYGNLIILKHNTSLLTAYAHNRNLLVTENQKVKRGQKIAEMGSSEADKVKLHFEVRRDGKPVDPSRYMPAR